MGAKINCSICGKLTDSSLDNCPHCGSPTQVGRPPAPPTPIVGSGSRTDHCPSCGATVQDGDIVCVRCGVSLLTGHRILNDKAESSPGSVRPRPSAALVAVALLLLVAGGGAVAFFGLRDPVKQARQQSRTGDLLGAVNLLQKHTDSQPDDAEAFAMLGRLHLQTQQYPDAATAFDKAFQLRPTDADLGFLAVIAAGKIQGDAGMQRQIAALERLVERHPDNAQAVKMLALAQGAGGALEASETALGRLTALGEPAEQVTKYQGVVEALTGDHSAARAALAGLPEGDPEVRAALGYLASLEGDRFAAADALSAVVTGGNADNVEARARLGLLYMAQGQFDQALPLLRPVEGGPPSDSARFFYALCLQTAGMVDEALMDFDRLVSGGGKFAEDAAIQMATIYLARNQVDQAAEATRKARKFGASARLYTIEGTIAALQGAEADAQDHFRRAIQADANYPAAHLEQGLMYVRRGVVGEGVRELELYLSMADPAISGARLTEVEMLVKQLKQSEGTPVASEAPAAPRTARSAAPATPEPAPEPSAPAEEKTPEVPLVETPVVVESPVVVETPAASSGPAS